jgi:hypothetical protein
VNQQRLELLMESSVTAPTSQGALVIDETGDRKWGDQTAHVGRQYLGSIGKVENGVVSVHSLWADERRYYPLEVEPYTPARWFDKGEADPDFRTKPRIALELVERAVQVGVPFRAVVADSFYGENLGFIEGLEQLELGYVLALRPSHAWWHPQGELGSVEEVARSQFWQPEAPGAWQKITRSFRDEHQENWWALEVVSGPYGPAKAQRLVIVTTDPLTLPELTTWYLLTNLPAPEAEQARKGLLPAWPKWCSFMVCGSGSSRVTSKSNTVWAGPTIRYAPTWLSDATGSWCAAPFRSVGGLALRRMAWNRIRLDNLRPLLRSREKKRQPEVHRSSVTWPMALRQVRAWLEPWIMLQRYWQA